MTRLMALAIKFQDTVDRGEVRDYADLARLGHVTRARMSQIMNLLLLAPDLQDAILFLAEGATGEMASERSVRKLCGEVRWDRQRQLWSEGVVT